MERHEHARRLVGTVHGTVVAASVLAIAGGGGGLDAIEVGGYVLATVVVFWLTHAWAEALGVRAAGEREYGLLAGLRHNLPVLEAAAQPLAALALAHLLGASDETAISIAIWVCVGTLMVLGAGVARDEGAPPHRVVLGAISCGALGLVMVGLKAVVH
jgi:hypothetical protein